MNKCIFLDRDGVINEERGTYTYRVEDFNILPGVKEAIRRFKNDGFLLVIITNQAGITRGIYNVEEMQKCHNYMMENTDHLIDDIYYAEYFPDYSHSLLRKPDSLMFEKAIAKYEIDPNQSWMIGNSERDMIPAIKLGIKTVFIGEIIPHLNINHYAHNLLEATEQIIKQ